MVSPAFASHSLASPETGPIDTKYQLVQTLLVKNHSEHALLLHKVLHNHLPHLLCSIYFLEGSTDQLNAAYEHDSIELETWSSTGALQIRNDDEMTQHLGDISYQQAYVEYFNSRVTPFGPNWKDILSEYLIRGAQPLLGGVSSELAIEALALNAIDYNDLHKLLYIPWNSGSDQSKFAPEVILSKIANDPRFVGLLSKPGVRNTMTILSQTETRTAVLEYFLMLDLSDIERLISQLSDLAVLFECAAHKPGSPAFDFYLNHALTFVWCLKVLIPEFPSAEHTQMLVRGAWLLMVLSYVTELRPLLTPALVEDVQLREGMTWKEILEEFHVNNEFEVKYKDPHFLRAMRNLMELGKLRKREGKEELYMKGAVKLREEWSGWSGLGREGDTGLNTK